MKPLSIPSEALAALQAHAREGYPHEVVGILAGPDAHTVAHAHALVNERADSPKNRYQVSGLLLHRAQQRLEDQGLVIVGYYHSHPDHTAQYSDYDRDHALPNLSYVIVSVQGGQPADLRSWRLREDRSAMDEQIILEQEPS